VLVCLLAPASGCTDALVHHFGLIFVRLRDGSFVTVDTERVLDQPPAHGDSSVSLFACGNWPNSRSGRFNQLLPLGVPLDRRSDRTHT